MMKLLTKIAISDIDDAVDNNLNFSVPDSDVEIKS